MYRYYLSKGHTLTSLLELSTLEKVFMIKCQELDLEEAEDMYKRMWGVNG